MLVNAKEMVADKIAVGFFYNVSKEVLCLYVLIVIWRLTLSGELKSDIS